MLAPKGAVARLEVLKEIKRLREKAAKAR